MELIQKYLNGDLTDEEQAKFQQKIKEDPNFAEEVEAATVLMARYKLQKKLHWKQLLEQQGQPNAAKVRSIARPKNYLIRRIAAAVLVLLAGTFTYWYFSAGPSVEDLVAEYVADHHIAPSALRALGDRQLIWEQAREAYQNNDFQGTIAAITQLRQSGELKAEEQFYLGLSYLYLPSPDYDKAIEALMSSRHQYGLQADWYLSLAYLQQGNPDQARELLTNIVESGSWHEEEAAKLLKRLNN